ncbi:MAG: tetratricopeptide repeat protein [Gemmatimonadales bacterium]|nr:tetratricopeptide repeat protein [Gemmatimonadales bacterium]
MTREALTLTAAILITALGMVLPAAGSTLEGSFWYTVDHITKVEEDGGILLWVTLPPERAEQSLTITKIVPEPVAILEDQTNGNRVIEWSLRPEAKYESTVSFFHFDFELEQKPLYFEIEATEVKPFDKSAPDYVQYTRSEIGIQTDGVILDQARKIVGRETNPWLQTNLIYDWIINSLAFVPGGFGEQDAKSTLEHRKGNCAQYSGLFTALCRSIGIPARTVTNSWTGGGMHVFAEIQLTNLGWVPMDPSLGQMLIPERSGMTPEEVNLYMSEKGIPLGDPTWLAGNLSDHRMITGVGNNISFHSPTLDQQVSFQQMSPGGVDAVPEAIRLTGLNRDIVHGGFFVFGQTLATEEEAHRIAHQRLARSFFKEGLYDVVDNACRGSYQESTDGILTWINAGKMYMHKEQYYKAEAAFKRAMTGVAMNRQDKVEALIWTHNYLGNCYDLLGQREMAEKEYQQVVERGNNYRGAVDYARKYLKKEFSKKASDD